MAHEMFSRIMSLRNMYSLLRGISRLNRISYTNLGHRSIIQITRCIRKTLTFTFLNIFFFITYYYSNGATQFFVNNKLLLRVGLIVLIVIVYIY